MAENIPVRVRDCAHPDSPHDGGDIVYIRPTLSLEGGIAAQQDLMSVGANAEELTRRWLVTFVRYGAVGANFMDPFDVDEILGDFELAMPVANAAEERYSEAVLRPLGLSRPTSSPRGRTAGSTSRTRRSARKSPVSS